MKFTELNPQWVGTGGEGITDKDGNPVPYREKVAIIFKCPCGSEKCGDCCISVANPPDGKGPMDRSALWKMTGDSFENLTLTPSIQRLGNTCHWHGFITNGEVVTV